MTEAVVSVGCAVAEEALTSGHTGRRLLAVAHQADGTLTGLAWVGPAGADFLSWWLVGDRLLIDASPGSVNAEDHFPHLPGLALSYRWQGTGFADSWEPAPEYPPIVPLDPEAVGAPVRLRPAVASGLRCPDAELRLSRSGDDWTGSEGAAGSTYTVPTRPFEQFLFDLDRTGDRLLVTELACARIDGSTASGLVVLERAGDGWQGISVLLPPAGQELGSWRMDGDLLAVEWVEAGDRVRPPDTYRWTGTVLEPVGE